MDLDTKQTAVVIDQDLFEPRAIVLDLRCCIWFAVLVLAPRPSEGHSYVPIGPYPHWTRRARLSKLGGATPCCNNSSVRITCAKQRMRQQV